MRNQPTEEEIKSLWLTPVCSILGVGALEMSIHMLITNSLIS